MPQKKTEIAPDGSAHNRALRKYRRKETLLRKIKELSQLCNINLNLLIEDKRRKKIFQYYTNEEIKVENLGQRLRDELDVSDDQAGKLRPLRIESIHVSQIGKKGNGPAHDELTITEEAFCEQMSEKADSPDDDVNSLAETLQDTNDRLVEKHNKDDENSNETHQLEITHSKKPVVTSISKQKKQAKAKEEESLQSIVSAPKKASKLLTKRAAQMDQFCAKFSQKLPSKMMVNTDFIYQETKRNSPLYSKVSLQALESLPWEPQSPLTAPPISRPEELLSDDTHSISSIIPYPAMSRLNWFSSLSQYEADQIQDYPSNDGLICQIDDIFNM